MMGWWLLAMLAYPETQSRAQAELDAVVGRARPPTFADYPHLPYIRAMVKETLRWRPVGPVGVPHRTTKDDWHEGMFIPKDTICIANVWHMNRDPEIFGENVEHFDPGRYLDARAAGMSDIKEQGHFAYGFGRRNCVGHATWPTIRCSSTSRSYFGQRKLNARRMRQAGCFPWTWMAGRMSG